MSDLQALFQQIKQLNDADLLQLQKYVNELAQPYAESLVRPPLDEDPETRIRKLREALDNFWEGVPQEEVDEIIAAMNEEYIEPLSKYDWLDEPDSHEDNSQ